jgi:hypothetical protein
MNVDAGARRRLAILAAGGGLAVALGVAYAPEEEAAAVVEPIVVARAPAGGAADAAPAPASAAAPATSAWSLREAIAVDPASDPFAAASFAPPPPPPPPPAPVVPPPPPPPPKAPPLPFSFVGLLEQGVARPQAFLARGDALFIVAAGDVIEDKYRVESLSPASIVLTYLPLSERQVLNASGSAQ